MDSKTITPNFQIKGDEVEFIVPSSDKPVWLYNKSEIGLR
jgi:hypothetical protein